MYNFKPNKLMLWIKFGRQVSSKKCLYQFEFYLLTFTFKFPGAAILDNWDMLWLEKCFTQIYRALYGNAMLVPFRWAPTWRPLNKRNICLWVLPLKQKIIPLECRHIKSSTSSIVRTVQFAKTWAITPLLTNAKALLCCHLLSRNSKTQKFKRPL